ncbi:TPM domain-containing protein [Bacillus vallismortis]|uniref:TPM domain-containing protein n=1 Tax=Bacillus vallismortis TaxID=72361 RepID=UPI00227F4135|nr:TPM domain-containing protein [Bacillus vallismortis]MCY8547166.1 TPM domain-containing protein [Bacillus vallismortis]
MRGFLGKAIFVVLAVFVVMPLLGFEAVRASESQQHVYDHAHLLTKAEIGKLESLSAELGAKRETDFIIITTKSTNGEDIADYAGDFYDRYGKGSTAILTIDMADREVYISGYQKAEKYLDNSRLNSIRNTISSDLSNEDYFNAFQTYIQLSYKGMGIKPGINPDSVFFAWWFQLIAAIAVGGIAVSIMLYHAGGKVTVNGNTYMDHRTSDVIDQYDTYIRTTVTRERKPSDKDSGGGGGGGVTKGGTSYSGSRGSF